MIKKNTAKMFFLASLLALPHSMFAIQPSTANGLTVAIAALSVGSSYYMVREFPEKMSPSLLASASVMMTALSYYALHRSTPAGRLKRANLLLNEIARHTLAKTKFDSDKLFFDVVQDVYLTDDLPLISAYNHLIALVPALHYALSLINKASAEVYKDVLLQEECDASLSRANQFFKNVSDAVKRIREHKDYLPQLNIYKENLLQAKQTIAQEQMALAQLQMAQAQQSNTFLNWLKAFCLGK